MCVSGAAMMMMAQGVQAVSSLANGFAQNSMAKADAAAERDAAAQQAEKIMRETRRRAGAARAATAASGAKLDEFALGTEQEIWQAGETDAAMSILSGNRRAETLRTQGSLTSLGGAGSAAGSLYTGAKFLGGWRGAKVAGTNDLYGVNGSNATEQWLRYGRGGD
jgi:hypothetical protein